VHARNARRGATRFDSIPRGRLTARRNLLFYHCPDRAARKRPPLHLPAGSKMYRKSYVHCAGVPRVYVPVFQITAPAFRVRSERGEIKRAEERGETAARAAGPRWQRENARRDRSSARRTAAVELSTNRAKYAQRACGRLAESADS